MDLEIIRSKKRKKTISARVAGDKIVVRVPARISAAQERDAVAKLVGRIERSRLRAKLNTDDELAKRAELINRRYFGGKLRFSSIKYVTNQNSRHGSCTSARGTIRISHTLAKMPDWVRDYVLVHELAHLVHPDHSKAFWNLVYRYEYAERARGYLLGYEAGKKDD
jgi:predicted metal-dependent hydrolase